VALPAELLWLNFFSFFKERPIVLGLQIYKQFLLLQKKIKLFLLFLKKKSFSLKFRHFKKPLFYKSGFNFRQQLKI
jgi:hypothetical protein